MGEIQKEVERIESEGIPTELQVIQTKIDVDSMFDDSEDLEQKIIESFVYAESEDIVQEEDLDRLVSSLAWWDTNSVSSNEQMAILNIIRKLNEASKHVCIEKVPEEYKKI